MPIWTPSQIATALWLDGSDASTITLSGSNVTNWADKSGNAKHCVQATPANRPIYSATGFNSKGSLFFDGGDFLRSTVGLTISTYNGDLHVFYVATRTDSAGGTVFTERNSSLIGTSQWFSLGGFNYISSNGSQIDSNHQFSNTNFSLLSTAGGVVSHSHIVGVRDALWLNGSVIAVPTGTATNITGSAGYTVAAREGAVGQFLTGHICEIVVLARATTTAERETIEGYLSHKWGTVANLDAGHPYKSTAPTVPGKNSRLINGTSLVRPAGIADHSPLIIGAT